MEEQYIMISAQEYWGSKIQKNSTLNAMEIEDGKVDVQIRSIRVQSIKAIGNWCV